MRRILIVLGLVGLLAPTAQARWVPEDRFADPVRASMWPIAAYDDTGRAFVAYASITNGFDPYWAEATVRDGAAWSAPVRVGDGTAATLPALIAAAGDGHAALVLLDQTGNGAVYSVARHTIGGWTEAVRLTDAQGGSSGLSLAVTAGGEVHLGWIEGGTRVRAARFADGFWSFVDVALVSAPDVTRIVIDGEGVPTIAWTDAHLTGTGWFAARRTASGWSTPQLAAYPELVDRGSALVLQDGQPLIVWGRTLVPGQYPTSIVESARFDGGQWGAIERVATEPRLGDVGAASIADGSAMAVWTGGPGGLDFDVRVTRRTAAGWSSPVQLNSTEGAFEPLIVAVGQAGAAVTWRWYDAPYGAALVDGVWSATQLAPDATTGVPPAIAGSRSGAVLVAWEDELVAPFAAVVRRIVAVPGAPTSASATGADASAEVAWTPPLRTNGSPIASYTVTSVPDGRSCFVVEPARACTVTGLRNGRAYRFQVVATNAEGSGAASETAPVTPRSRPVVRIASTSSRGGVLRTWVVVNGPGVLTQVGRSAIVERPVCRVARTIRRASRVLVVCVPPPGVRRALPCRAVPVRLVTVFRSPDRVTRRLVRVAQLDACVRATPVAG